MGWQAAHRVAEIWLSEASTGDQLLLRVHPFHPEAEMPVTLWKGRRQPHRVRWETAAAGGPFIMWVAKWDLVTTDRATALEELRTMLHESEWGKVPDDALGWRDGKAYSASMLRPQQLSSQALLETFQKSLSSDFEIILCQGSDHPGPRSRPLNPCEKAFRACQRECSRCLHQGLLVDLGWRSLEMESDPPPGQF